MSLLGLFLLIKFLKNLSERKLFMKMLKNQEGLINNMIAPTFIP